MSVKQADQILAAMRGEAGVLAALAFNTHLRLGEVLALRWLDVDLQNRYLVVRRSVSEVNKEQIETTTKTGRERRVDFDAETESLLRDHSRTRLHRGTDRVFKRPDGTAMRHWHVETAWKAARGAAGLAQYRFHDLRHAGLTVLGEAGASIRSIMDRAGHTTIAAAMNYQHRGIEQGRSDAAMFAKAKREARNPR